MSASQRLVVIGGTAAGASAAAKARRTNPDLEILMLERSAFVSYGSCGLPYLIGGVITDHRQLIARTPEDFTRSGIQVRTRHEVTRIDPERRLVTVRDLEHREVSQEPFDTLVLSTGGVAARPPIPGIDLPGVFQLRTIEDGLAIRGWLQEHYPRQAVIVGGGYIGLEMAEAFRTVGLDVTVVEMLPQVMPNLDPDMAQLVLEEVTRQEVTVLLSHRVERIEGDGRVQQVIAGDQVIPAGIVLVATGVKPNVTLAEEAGIALGSTGAVAVDDHQRTNVPGIYAAGDVAEAYHRVTSRPAYVPLGTTANKQGRVAGENAAGGDARFHGIVGTAVAKIFGLEVARTGLTEGEAQRAGWDVRTTTIKHGAIAHYMPDPVPLHVKLIYQPGTGRLLGAQMIGRRGAAKRIDVIAAALHAGWTVEELSRLDLSYAPPYAPVWDPILVAANVALKNV